GPVERDGDDGPERRARGHAERERRGERVPEQPLEHDAGRREQRADAGARERAREPRDEKDLRVGVVRKRGGEVERPAEADRRRADERRQQQRSGSERAERRDRADEPPLERHAGGPPPTRRIGTTRRWPDGCRSISVSTSYTRRRLSGVSTSSVAPRATIAPSRRRTSVSQSVPARPMSCVEITMPARRSSWSCFRSAAISS